MIFIIVFFLGCNNDKQMFEISEKDWNQARGAFSELKEALRSENGQLWNHSLEGPLMFVNRDTRKIIANEHSKGLIKRDSLFIGQLPEKINIANTAFDWNGKH